MDAAAIATSVLVLEQSQLRNPRQDDGVRAALRVLVSAREQMTIERTAKVNALTALLRTVDLGVDARRSLTDTKITEIAHWRVRDEPLAAATARTEALGLAKRITALASGLKDNHTSTTRIAAETGSPWAGYAPGTHDQPTTAGTQTPHENRLLGSGLSI